MKLLAITVGTGSRSEYTVELIPLPRALDEDCVVTIHFTTPHLTTSALLSLNQSAVKWSNRANIDVY